MKRLGPAVSVDADIGAASGLATGRVDDHPPIRGTDDPGEIALVATRPAGHARPGRDRSRRPAGLRRSSVRANGPRRGGRAYDATSSEAAFFVVRFGLAAGAATAA